MFIVEPKTIINYNEQSILFQAQNLIYKLTKFCIFRQFYQFITIS